MMVYRGITGVPQEAIAAFQKGLMPPPGAPHHWWNASIRWTVSAVAEGPAPPGKFDLILVGELEKGTVEEDGRVVLGGEDVVRLLGYAWSLPEPGAHPAFRRLAMLDNLRSAGYVPPPGDH